MLIMPRKSMVRITDPVLALVGVELGTISTAVKYDNLTKVPFKPVIYMYWVLNQLHHEKTCFWVFDHVRHELGCMATVDGFLFMR